MPQELTPTRRIRQISANEKIRRRIQAWEEEDPSSLLTKQIEKATQPLQWLVSLILPDRIVHEILDGSLRAAEVLTDRGDVFKVFNVGTLEDVRALKVETSDHVSDQVQFWATGAAAALGAWDVAGPLGIAPALVSLLTLSFRTIKKVGLCFGYDTSTPGEELIALQIFFAASTLYHRDKVQALKTIKKLEEQIANHQAPTPTDVAELISKLAHAVTQNLQKRRTLASIPAMGALVGSSTNAWLLNDVGWAARNIYSDRRLRKRRDERAVAIERRATPRTGNEDNLDNPIETDEVGSGGGTPGGVPPVPEAA